MKAPTHTTRPLIRLTTPCLGAALLLMGAISASGRNARPMDFPNFKRYQEANAKLPAPAPGAQRVVFMGDSITDHWIQRSPKFFSETHYIDRGISGQTTEQMLIRFRPDVIDLKPAVVVILAGINDIAGNTGPTTPEQIEGNLMSMVQLAQANGIKVVLSSILPANRIPWRKSVPNPATEIVKINQWMKAYAEKHGCVYLDYYSAMIGPDQSLKPSLAHDAVHPNAAGYAVMEPLVKQAIAKALGKS